MKPCVSIAGTAALLAASLMFCTSISAETAATNVVVVSSLGEKVFGAGDLKPGGTSKFFFGDSEKYWVERRVRVDSGKVPYVLVSSEKVAGEVAGDAVDLAAVSLTVGDAYCTGWYCSGWWAWNIPGMNLKLPLSAFRILESGRQGLVEQVRKSDDGVMGARYLVYPGDDKVMVEWMTEGPYLSDDAGLTVSALPGRHQSLESSRQVTTGLRSISDNTQNAPLDLTQEWWLVCSDRTYTKGTCALIFPKDGFGKVLVSTKGVITIRATPAGDANRIRMAFWDFPDKDQAWTVKHLREVAQKARDDLFAARFECTSALEFNKDIGRKEIEKFPSSPRRSKTLEVMETAKKMAERYYASPSPTTLWAFEGAVRGYRCALRGLRRANGEKLRIVTVNHAEGWKYTLAPVYDKLQLQAGEICRAVAKGIETLYFQQNLENFPSPDELTGYDCVVLADADCWALLRDGQEAVAEFVRNGGGLVVLGGNNAYGHSRVLGPLATEALPVEVKDRFDLETLPPGVMKLQGHGKQLFGTLDWKKKPVVYWHHRLALKPGAEILAAWQDTPLVVAKPYGAGQVIAFTGTILGVPSTSGELPIWDWPDFAAFISRMILYACGRAEGL